MEIEHFREMVSLVHYGVLFVFLSFCFCLRKPDSSSFLFEFSFSPWKEWRLKSLGVKRIEIAMGLFIKNQRKEMKNIVFREKVGMVVFILMVHFGNFVRLGLDQLKLVGTTGLLNFFFYFQKHIFLILHFLFSQKPSKEAMDDKFPPLGRWFSENKTFETEVVYDNLQLTMVFSFFSSLWFFSFSFSDSKNKFFSQHHL